MTSKAGQIDLVMRAGILPVALLFAILPAAGQSLLDIPCLFDRLLGYQCTGCGMKSAVGAAISGDWQRASSINPFALAVTALIAGISGNAWHSILRRGLKQWAI